MFRVLDLGAHDGFVTNWLARQLGGQLHVDGVELNSYGVSEFNRRAGRDQIDGECKRGRAEDAPDLFPIRSYDAVVAYELIEHVPDVDAFLYACERMCKDDGLVFISTPNGTFGTGQNPHHLWTWTAPQLYDLLRRRGEVVDMLPGEDGVTVLCYRPYFNWGVTSKPELAIYCGGGWEKWHPMDIETKGLGGSETAAVRLAEKMSEKYTVTVYAECDTAAYKQVLFKHHASFDPMEERHTVISSRIPELVDRKVNAANVLLWMHDTDYGPRLTQERVEKFDAIMVLSEWHCEHVELMYPYTDKKLVITGNGIEPAYFKGHDSERFPRVALYSSSPDRGLDLILKLWPRVREQVPDAELVYCYASVYDKIADTNAQIAAFREATRGLADQPGVQNLGSLTQPKLAKVMSEIGVWLAPSYNTVHDVPFCETYCIGAVEAAAAGCCIVVSDWGALPERTETAVNSVLIPAPEDGNGIDEDQWVSGIVNAMTQVEHEQSVTALATTWDVVASDFDRVITNGVATANR